MTGAQFAEPRHVLQGGPGHQPRPPRKNLMLAASIESSGTKVPVRIRNLSETGAMLDGAALPHVGAPLLLLRSDIQVAGAVVWRDGGRCGMRFDNVAASVDEWVAGKRAAVFQSYQGQARVDAIQSVVRSGGPLPDEPTTATASGLQPGELERRLAEEVIHVQRLVDAVGEELVEDPVMLQRHLRVLQNLDRASQILEHIGAVLDAGDRVAAADRIVMQDLRERLLRKPIF